jgi:aminoglycoside phosphotransferase (APT) family kinase protein
MYQFLSDETDIPVPDVLGFEEDRSLLGDRFFLMQRVAGQVPPDDPPFHQAGWVTQLSTEERHAMWRNAVEVMARLHAVDPEALPILKRPHLGRSGLEQELRHWLTYAKWCGGDQHSIVAAAGKWLLDNFPDDPPTTLSWGDSRVGNMIFQGSEVVAVLDWDMVSLAGPEADLAWYLIMDQAATVSQGVPRLPGFGTPQDTVALWEALSGRNARNLDWHAVFTSYRMAGIMIRLATMLKSQGRLAPESQYLLTNNIGIQWLSQLLHLPPAGPITTPWLGWDR